MMKWQKKFWFFLIGIFLIVVVFFNEVFAQSSSTKSIEVTIKISVCGNGTIEGGEDCEGENLNGQTCESLGYGGGTLTCDIACSFDTYGCSPAPTPTPTSTPTPTLTPTSTAALIPTSTPTSQPAATSTPAPAATATPSPAATPTPAPALVPPSAIPLPVAAFDIDGNGKIEVGEVFSAVKSWVEEWKNVLLEEIKIAQGEISPEVLTSRKCDVNRDKSCNLQDLSILLYYIGR